MQIVMDQIVCMSVQSDQGCCYLPSTKKSPNQIV